MSEFNDRLPDVCDTIATWNGTKLYSPVNNCQKLSEILLSHLQIQSPFKTSPKIEEFIDSLESLDQRSIPFTFSLNGAPPTAFSSHKALDQYCFENGDELENGSDDWKILKAFDRVYWLRYYAAREDPHLSDEERNHLLHKFEPSDHKLGCYFQDPSKTSTLWGPGSPPSVYSRGEQDADPIEMDLVALDPDVYHIEVTPVG